MAVFSKCRHTAEGYNAMGYRDHGKRRIRCRCCYNEMRVKYQRRRVQEAREQEYA